MSVQSTIEWGDRFSLRFSGYSYKRKKELKEFIAKEIDFAYNKGKQDVWDEMAKSSKKVV